MLFPIHHGILCSPGMDVLPPLVVYGNHASVIRRFSRMRPRRGTAAADDRGDRPVPFRKQTGGDDELPALRLREGLEASDGKGFNLYHHR
ncbi:hypothetical protein [Nocardia sp. NPDC051463]|uniref:hypothetical protein n=1 Tax=Nocardia sp. NPDC051463 TaxID=3154845 RepID=UPI0034377FB6